MDIFRLMCEWLAARADIRVNGDRPWDVQVHDTRAFERAIVGGSVGLGDGYVDGWWTCRDLEELARRFAMGGFEDTATLLPGGIVQRLASLASNQQTRGRSLRVARQHYSFGNDLFFEVLGAHKSYSCGYFRDTTDLDVAQEQKLDLLCQKLCLRPGDHLLDVGGGWGAFAHRAASKYGARVTSINISDEQIRHAREHCRGLDVEVVRCDYRDLRGTFDKVAAVAMFTHVGYRNYRTFMEAMHRALKPGGVFLMEGIWGNVSTTHIDAWFDKYIFPGSMFPSGAQTFQAFEGLFVAEDLHNFGPHYVDTLRAWNKNLHVAWPRLSARYDERVRRIFEYYFLVSAGYFRARSLQNWQLVLTRQGCPQPPSRLS